VCPISQKVSTHFAGVPCYAIHSHPSAPGWQISIFSHAETDIESVKHPKFSKKFRDCDPLRFCLMGMLQFGRFALSHQAKSADICEWCASCRMNLYCMNFTNPLIYWVNRAISVSDIYCTIRCSHVCFLCPIKRLIFLMWSDTIDKLINCRQRVQVRFKLRLVVDWQAMLQSCQSSPHYCEQIELAGRDITLSQSAEITLKASEKRSDNLSLGNKIDSVVVKCQNVVNTSIECIEMLYKVLHQCDLTIGFLYSLLPS
jgi:hypothetical protein